MSTELNDIMNEASADILKEKADQTVPDDFDLVCQSYLDIKDKIKKYEKMLAPFEKQLKSMESTRSEKFQLIHTPVESFRMKAVSTLEKEGWTKEKIMKEGVGGFTKSSRMKVSQL